MTLNRCFVPVSKSAPPSSAVPDATAVVFQSGFSTTHAIVGSAFVQLGQSKVVCYAYAPRASTGKGVSFEEAVVECKCSFASHLQMGVDIVDDVLSSDDSQSTLEHVLSQSVLTAVTPAIRLSSYPKTTLSLAIVVLQSSLQDLSAAITASSLALSDAKIELRDLVVSYTLEQAPIPSVTSSHFRVTVAAMCAADDLTLVHSQGSRPANILLSSIDAARTECQVLRTALSNHLKSKVV